MDKEDKTPLQQYVEENPVYDWAFSENLQTLPIALQWKDIDAMEFSDNRWIVRDLFPKEGITIFASISGEGKSLLLMHLAKCISEGSAWFGHEAFQTEKARVLYVNCEMSLSEMQRRGRLIGFDPANEDLVLLNADDLNLNEGIRHENLNYKWLLDYIHQNHVSVVIIDTFRAVCGGLKEEKAEEVREFFQKFLILKNSGVSVIFLEHLRKATQFEGKVPRREQLFGSQDKMANAEVLLMIHRDDSSGDINIYQRKNRLGNEIKPFAVKILDTVDPSGLAKIEFQYVGEINDDVNKKEEAKELLRNTLSTEEGLTTNQLIELLKKQVGTKNTRSALREMTLMGEVVCSRVGKQNTYRLPSEEPKTQEEGVVSNQENIF